MDKRFMSFFFFFVCQSLPSLAQSEFVQGYIITADGTKEEVRLDYRKWKNNPDKLRYTRLNSETVQTAGPGDILGFGSEGSFQYASADVRIDESPDLTIQLLPYREPKWTQEKVFLKQILESEVSLFSFSTPHFRRYFYKKTSEDEYHQLIYKRYRSQNVFVQENNDFRKQLFDNVNCHIEQSSLKNIDYNESDLTKYFQEHNRCLGKEVTVFSISKKGSFEIKVKGGVGFYSGYLTFFQDFNLLPLSATSDFSVVAPRVGFDFEYLSLFGKTPWSLYFEPFFESFETTGVLNNVPVVTFMNGSYDLQLYTQDYEMAASRFSFGIGVRKYLVFSSKQRLFVGIGVQSGFATYTRVEGRLDPYYEAPDLGEVVFEPTETHNYQISLGYALSNWNIELRYNTDRNLVLNLPTLGSEISGFSFLAGYRLSKRP